MVKKISGTPGATARTAKRDVATPIPAEAISHRAYQRFQGRGAEHGHDVEDWLLAEADLLEGSNAAVSRTPSSRRSTTPRWTR